MKKYSTEERGAALKKLPRPASYFVGSKALFRVYQGLKSKFELTDQQGARMVEICNLTLIGLEDSHAIEANIHQMMPELANSVAKELALDIQDRVLKEAERHVREEIFEQEAFVFNEMGLTPEEEAARQRQFTIDAMEDDDPELLKILEEEKATRDKVQAEQDEELAKALLEAKTPRTKSALTKEADAISAPTTAPSTTESNPTSIPEPALAISTQKLSTPTTQQTGVSEVEAVLARPSVAAIPVSTPIATVISTEQKQERPQPIAPTIGKSDPYREPVDEPL